MSDTRFARSLLALAALALAAGGTPVSSNPDAGDAPDAGVGPRALELIGAWAEDWGGESDISAESWGGSAVVAFDNDANWAVLRAADDAAWNPGTFSKVVWTEPEGGGFWTCTIAFGAATAEAARDTTNVADASDPATTGCGGFPWTWMTPALEIRGAWADNFGGETELTSHAWGFEAVVKYGNEENFAITRSPADAPWSPNTFSKQVWTELADGSFWACTVAYGQATAAEAEATTNVADPADPANAGCGGFGWTRMTPALAIRGTWFDGWADYALTSFRWGPGTVAKYDNAARWAVTQNPADDEWSPNTFAKQVWTHADGALWQCTVAFGLETAAAAESTTEVADAANPAAGGCGGFPWSKYVPSIELLGEWSVDDEPFRISSAAFGNEDVRAFDNRANTAVLQARGENGGFSKYQWTDPANGSFLLCRLAGSLATLAEAQAVPANADSTNHATGCNGLPWLTVGPAIP